MDILSPIIIFCYRRKIDQLLNSLLKNKEAKYSNLIIFSDGYKSEEDRNDVLNLRKSIKNIEGFKSVYVYKSASNKGLAKSIIDGVDIVIKNYGQVIVLEDDLIVSEYFLNFMNKSLELNKDNKNIWSISGYSPPLKSLQNYKNDVYLSLRSSCWGWGTWLNRWNKIEWNIKNFHNLRKNKNQIKRLNKGGNDLFKMLELQYLKKINSWAIIWCYSQFLNSTYSLMPKISMVQNNGFGDPFSTHNSRENPKWIVKLSKKKIINFSVSVDDEIIKEFKKFHDLSFSNRIGFFLRRWVMKSRN